MSDLDERVALLEAQTLRLRRDASRMRLLASLACAALVGVTALGAGAVSRSASPVAITDAKGMTRVRLDVTGLHVFDANGKERILVGFNSSAQPVVHLNDRRGSLRESMYLSPSETPGLDQYDSHTDEVVTLWGAGDGSYLRLSEGGKERTYLGITKENDGLLQFDYANGNKNLVVSATSSPFLSMYDSGGTNRVDLGFYSNGQQGVQFNNASGTLLWGSP